MAGRRRTPKSVETQVLLESGRRCCICFGLHDDYRRKKGQIAHVDHDPSNTILDNLAWLCLEHHDEYDSTTSQAKGITAYELKEYRLRLASYKAQRPSPTEGVTAQEEAAEPTAEVEWRALSHNETLFTNLQRVDGLPPRLWLAETEHRRAIQVWQQLREITSQPLDGAFLLKAGRILSCFDLTEWPWRTVCDEGTIEHFSSEEWADSEDEDRLRELVHLLNLTLRSLTHRDLTFNRQHDHLFLSSSDQRASARSAMPRAHEERRER